MSDSHRGTCLCGAVSVTADGAPKWVVNCHCRDCQKATGSAFATYAGFEAGRVTITDDRGDSAVERETSPGVHRAFCGTCGTPISYRSDKWPGEIHLFTMLLDDAEVLPPMAHVQMAEAMPWLRLDDGLPQYQRFVEDDPEKEKQ